MSRDCSSNGTLFTPEPVKAVEIMHTCCMHCGQQIHGPCKALGQPYYGLLHNRCLPVFAFNGYCHPHPMSTYRRIDLIGSRNMTQEMMNHLAPTQSVPALPSGRASSDGAVSTSLSTQALAYQR